MKLSSHTIHVRGGAEMQVLDLSAELAAAVRESGVREGLASLFVSGATAGLTTIEFEDGCVEDLKRAFELLAPRHGDYAHELRWHDGNGHAHVRAALLGPSLTVPVRAGRPSLGTWQQVVLVDFDPPARERQVIVQVLGE